MLVLKLYSSSILVWEVLVGNRTLYGEGRCAGGRKGKGELGGGGECWGNEGGGGGEGGRLGVLMGVKGGVGGGNFVDI